MIKSIANVFTNNNTYLDSPTWNETSKKIVNVAFTFFTYSGLKLLLALSLTPAWVAINACECILNQGKKYRDKIQGKEKVALILQADDFGHSLSRLGFSRFARFSLCFLYGWSLRSRYSVFKYTIKNFKEIKGAFSDLKDKQIAMLVIRAHGGPLSMCLSIEENIDVRNASKLKTQLQQLLPEGVIILHSCSTGDSTNRRCIAKKIAKLAPGRRVFAPTKTCSSVYTYKMSSMEIEFQEPRKKENFFRGLLNTSPHDIFNAFPFIPKLEVDSITACYEKHRQCKSVLMSYKEKGVVKAIKES